MDVTEIVNRQPMTYTIEEQVYVIEQYIKERKGKTVKVNPFKELSMVHSHIHKGLGMQKIQDVNLAFNDAANYYLNK